MTWINVMATEEPSSGAIFSYLIKVNYLILNELI